MHQILHLKYIYNLYLSIYYLSTIHIYLLSNKSPSQVSIACPMLYRFSAFSTNLNRQIETLYLCVFKFKYCLYISIKISKSLFMNFYDKFSLVLLFKKATHYWVLQGVCWKFKIKFPDFSRYARTKYHDFLE